MNALCRYAKMGVSVFAWSGVLMMATYGTHPTVLGPYSWGIATLLSLLMCIAVMAEPLSSRIVGFWIKKASHTAVAGQMEQGMGPVMATINAFTIRLIETSSEARSFFASLFMSCKRVTRRLVSSGSHL